MTARDFQPTVSVKTSTSRLFYPSTSRLLYPSIIRHRFSSSVSRHQVRRFFIDNLPSFKQSPVFLLSLLSSGWEVFHQQHDPLRLISFPTGLGYFHFPRFSSSVSLMGLGGFSPSSYQQMTLRSTKFVSKKEGNCNVIVTKPTNHIISTRDHSHDLLT